MNIFYDGLKYGMIVAGVVSILSGGIRIGIKMINHFK